MSMLDDIKEFLPRYLSEEKLDELLENLDDFPNNIKKIYNPSLNEDNLFQGDGVLEFPYIDFPNEEIKKVKAMILSNTCDISPENKRPFVPRLSYVPIFSLEKYKASLERNRYFDTKDKLENHIVNIKKQKMTQIFYLPEGGDLKEDCIVFLDRIVSCSTKIIDTKKLKEIKLFSLSNYGFYIFLFKLSIHFTRIREKHDRDLLHPIAA